MQKEQLAELYLAINCACEAGSASGRSDRATAQARLKEVDEYLKRAGLPDYRGLHAAFSEVNNARS